MSENTKFKKTSYRLAALLIVLALTIGACVNPSTPEVEVGAEVVQEAELAEGEEVVVEDMAETDSTDPGTMNANNSMISAWKLLDYDFRNINGDVSGEIENILIDISTGQILFVTIEYGGFLDIGDTHLAMPLSAFTWSMDNELVLNIEEERLQNFPSLDESWPNLTDPLWDDELRQFWLDLDVNPGIELNDDTSQVMYISDLLGWGIGDIEFGQGKIHDVLINLTQSRGRYVVVDYGDELFEDNLIAVPFSAFHGRAIDDQLHFSENIDLVLLEGAPTLERDGFGKIDIFENEFDVELIKFWDDSGFTVEQNSTP